MNFVDCCFAYAPRGGIDDSQKRNFVGGINDDLQIGENVADFLSIVKFYAANYLIRNFAPYEGLFDCPALGVDSIKDGDVGKGHTLVNQSPDIFRDAGGLLDFIFIRLNNNFARGRFCSDKAFFLSALVIGDEPVSNLKDAWSGTEIFFKADNHGIGPVMLKIEYVSDVSPPPTID